MDNTKSSISKKQYAHRCLTVFFLGIGIIILSAFLPILSVGYLEWNSFQLLSFHEASNTNSLSHWVSPLPFLGFVGAVIDGLIMLKNLNKKILPRINNDECIKTLVKKVKDNIYWASFYLVAPWLLILMEHDWDLLALFARNSLLQTTAFAYIPLVLQIVLFCIVKSLKPNEAKNNVVKQDTPQQNSIDEDSNVIELLTKYKELLDSGIITQEEYDQKKKEIWRK